MGTVLVSLALAGLLGLAVRSIYKEKKTGGCSGCGGSCSCCPSKQHV